jgi:hypothetical protein
MKRCLLVWHLIIFFAISLVPAMGCRERSTPGSETQEPLPSPGPATKLAWRFVCNVRTGQRLVTDKCLLIDVDYIVLDQLPTGEITAEKVERILDRNTTHGFVLANLRTTPPDGNYLTPTGIILNRKYVGYLRGLSMKKSLRFRASGPDDPVIILDGDRIIGALMPMGEEQ